MPLKDDLNNVKGAEESAIITDSPVYNKETIAIPRPERSFGIDTKNNIFDNIVNAGESGTLDISALDSFSQVS